MKKPFMTSLGLILFMALISFSGCEDIKSLADVHFNTNLIADLNILIPEVSKKSAMDATYSFTESVTVDMRDDDDIDEYFDKLKSFDIQDVTGTVKTMTGAPVTLVTGTLTIRSGSKTASWEVQDFVLQQGASFTFGNEEGQWDTVNEILDAKEVFTVTMAGETDKAGVSFVLSIDIAVKVTANPLD